MNVLLNAAHRDIIGPCLINTCMHRTLYSLQCLLLFELILMEITLLR
jgi:hypothetical protein